MNERPAANRLREALRRADLDEIEDAAVELGRQAVAVAIAEPPDLRQDGSAEAERQRLLDAAFGDVMEIVNRHRMRLGRRVCSSSDARLTRQIYELLRGMAGPDGGCDNDPSFQ